MKDRWTIAAETIGLRVLASAREEGDGLWWHQAVPQRGSTMISERSPDLWGGAAGIALFLLELYRVTRSPDHLEAARRALVWCVREVPNVPAHRRAGFINGGLATAYVLCRAHDIVGDDGFIDQASTLTLQLVEAQESWPGYDLLSGLAGTLLVVAHVASRHADPALLRTRQQLLQTLIRGSRPHATGLFWDASPRWALPLCGMAHGPSGIAFVLGQLLGPQATSADHPLHDLIAEGLAYEDQYFDEAVGNWPDHRGATSADAPREFMNGWCHGAAGIGMARLGLDTTSHRAAVLHHAAVATTTRDIDTALADSPPERSLTLCHGLAGLADFLLMAKRAESRRTAEKVGDAAIEQFARPCPDSLGNGSSGADDNSLFVGTAGVGLFLLRLADPIGVPSVLRPTLPASHLAPPDAGFVWHALERTFFRRTRRFLAAHVPDDVRVRETGAQSAGRQRTTDRGETPEAPEPAATLVRRVRERLTGRARSLDPRDRERARDLLALEAMHIRVAEAVEDYVQLCRGWNVPNDAEHSPGLAGDPILRVRPGVWTYRTEWNWTEDAEGIFPAPHEPPGQVDVLIVTGLSGSTDRRVSSVGAQLFRHLRKPARLSDVLAELDCAERDQARAIASAGVATGLLLTVGGTFS